MTRISSVKSYIDPIPEYNTILAVQTYINQPKIESMNCVYLGRDGRIYVQLQPSGFFSWLSRFVNFLERVINEKTFSDQEEWLKELALRVKDAIPQPAMLVSLLKMLN